MCHLWLQVLPVNFDPAQGDPRMALQEALARHNVEKNPGDFEAHYNLAAMLQAKDKLDAAIREYQQAVRLRPDDAAGNNALGAALVARGIPSKGDGISAGGVEGASGLFRCALQLGIRAGRAERFRRGVAGISSRAAVAARGRQCGGKPWSGVWRK